MSRHPSGVVGVSLLTFIFAGLFVWAWRKDYLLLREALTKTIHTPEVKMVGVTDTLFFQNAAYAEVCSELYLKAAYSW